MSNLRLNIQEYSGRLRRSGTNASSLKLTLVVSVMLLGADSPREAVEKVREGLNHFRGGAYSDAETAFDEASEISPENATIKFDKACAALAGGDADQARGLFQSAAQAKDSAVAVRAHYNLGCLEADQARAKLGDDPATAVGDVREESIKLLLTSVRHYRDVLNLNPTHKDARHNLELIRIFIKHIQSQWAERDRQRDREEKDLLQFVLMLEEKETAMRSVNRRLQPADDGVQKRQALRENADAQRTLQEEIEPLKEKIAQAFAPPTQQSGQAATQTPPQPDEQQQEALEMLNGIADEIGSAMLSAANATASSNLDDAIESQTKSLGLLNQIYMVAAPYENVLQRSIQVQSALAPPEADETDDEEVAEDETDNEPADSKSEPVEPGEDDVENQERISDWARLLPLKAEAMLPQVKQQMESLKASLPPEENAADVPEEAVEPDEVAAETEQETAKANTESEDEQTDEEEPSPEEPSPEEAQAAQLKQQAEQMKGLVKSMELAIERAPEAEKHSRSAAEYLTSNQLPEAVPEQQETLRILKEIAEPLQQEQQNQDQQQNEDQQNQQDESQDDQQNQDENQQQDQQQNDDSSQQQKNPQQQEEREQEAKQQRAESVLQQARERERKHREDMKKIRAYLMRGMKVDKDW